jgi:hypothetical protein
MYVGNIQAQLTRTAYQAQSFKHMMGQQEANQKRKLEQYFVVAHVKDIEVKQTKAGME